ncbi:MAG: START domain-containing protein [Nitrospira sp.]
MALLQGTFEKRIFLVRIILYFLTLGLSPAQGGEWVLVSDAPQLTVYMRDVGASSVPEFKAVGIVDALPSVCWNVIQDFASYTNTMPFVKESRIINQDSDGIYLYSIIDPNRSLVWPRDFTIKVSSDSSAMTMKWSIADNWGPEVQAGYVRVKKNTGSWQLRPLPGDGTKTEVTYQIHTEPGGVLELGSKVLPNWVQLWVNSDALPELFRKLADAVKLIKYQQ